MVRANKTARISTGWYHPPRYQYEPMEPLCRVHRNMRRPHHLQIKHLSQSYRKWSLNHRRSPRRSYSFLMMKKKVLPEEVKPHHRHKMDLLKMMSPLP